MTSSRVVYIVGTGHSGSTLLELILSTADKTFSVGGLRYLDRYFNGEPGAIEDDQGKKAANSFFWADFYKNKEKYLCPKVVEPTLSFKNRLHLLIKGVPSIVPHRYKDEVLYQDIRKKAELVTGKKVHTIIDSSKTLARLIEVRETAGVDVYVIYLVRDVRGVVNSNRKHGKSVLRSIQYWLTDNIYITRYLRSSCSSQKYRKIRYEQLVQNPDAVIREINSWLGVSIGKDFLVSKINDQKSYRFAGNLMRHKTFTGIRKDESWRYQLSWYWRYLLWPVSFLFK